MEVIVRENGNGVGRSTAIDYTGHQNREAVSYLGTLLQFVTAIHIPSGPS